MLGVWRFLPQRIAPSGCRAAVYRQQGISSALSYLPILAVTAPAFCYHPQVSSHLPLSLYRVSALKWKSAAPTARTTVCLSKELTTKDRLHDVVLTAPPVFSPH